MDNLDDIVLAAYDRIFALPPDQIQAALAAHWKQLAQSCTAEHPCVECRRELQAQAQAELEDAEGG